MRKTVYNLMAMSFLAVSLTAFAQSGDTMKQDSTMKQGDQMKHDNMKADNMSNTAVTISGKVSRDGKMFVSDKGAKTWTVSNPETLKGNEGHRVTISADVDAAKNRIHVTAVKTQKDGMKDNMKKASAFESDSLGSGLTGTCCTR